MVSSGSFAQVWSIFKILLPVPKNIEIYNFQIRESLRAKKTKIAI